MRAHDAGIIEQKIRKALRDPDLRPVDIIDIKINFMLTPSAKSPGKKTLTLRVSWNPRTWEDVDTDHLEQYRLYTPELETEDGRLHIDPRNPYGIIAELDGLPPEVPIRIELRSVD
jgi:hypothetical protein